MAKWCSAECLGTVMRTLSKREGQRPGKLSGLKRRPDLPIRKGYGVYVNRIQLSEQTVANVLGERNR